MTKFHSQLSLLLFALTFIVACTPPSKNNQPVVIKSDNSDIEILEIDSVWAANKVSFALQTVGNKQFVAYYDSERMMTVASREIGSDNWIKKTLPNKLKWDSHNYVAMGIDELGYIHISGNMHVNPLVYFRSTKPYHVQSIVEINKMTGVEESDVTYPKFFNDGDDRLYFSYRSGTCGNGNILINQYDPKNETWKRYLNKPLFEGIEKEDVRAAYHKYLKDSDGNFHFLWMWRWTPDVATSHQIAYATSPDLINWKNAAGEEVSLPFRPDDPKVMVDPTPTKGGMHNSRFKLILDQTEKPIVAYVKYDDKGLSQLYLAKHESQQWVSKQISDWDFRWEFFGGGDKMTMGGNFDFEGFSDEGLLIINWKTETGNSGQYAVNPQSLELSNKAFHISPKYPPVTKQKTLANPKMSVTLQDDVGHSSDGYKYVLKWEAMPKSHGRHAPKIIPEKPLSPLSLIKFSRKKTDNSNKMN